MEALTNAQTGRNKRCGGTGTRPGGEIRLLQFEVPSAEQLRPQIIPPLARQLIYNELFSIPDTDKKHHEPTGRFFTACELRPYPSYRSIKYRQPISRRAPEACSDNFRCLLAGWLFLYQGMRIRHVTVYDLQEIFKFWDSFVSHIQNHGIPEELVSGIHNAAARFFDLPEEEKMKFYIGNSQVTISHHSSGPRDLSAC